MQMLPVFSAKQKVIFHRCPQPFCTVKEVAIGADRVRKMKPAYLLGAGVTVTRHAASRRPHLIEHLADPWTSPGLCPGLHRDSTPGHHSASHGSQGQDGSVMAFAAPPPKAHCFNFSAPEGSTVDDIIDALEAVTGPAGIRSLQHMGGAKFGAAAANVHAATKLKSRGAILLNGESVPLVSVGPEIVHVTIFRVPLWVGDAALATVLSAYGNVQHIHEPVFKGHPGVGTGVRVVRVEMKSQIPNFLTVQGYNVMCDYRGVKKVCSKCRNAGHIAKDCATPRCTRCNVFGHATEGSAEPCHKCSGSHATADCVRPKSFAVAAAAATEEQACTELTPALQDDYSALEPASDTDTSDTDAHTEPQNPGNLPPLPEKASSTLHDPSETSDFPPDAYEDHSSSKAEARVPVLSRDHECYSSDTVGTTSSSEAPRTSMGRGTRTTGRADAPAIGPEKTTTVIMPLTTTSTHASKCGRWCECQCQRHGNRPCSHQTSPPTDQTLRALRTVVSPKNSLML
ncbi:uncharacterized protein LOC142769276 [Rhipicephalus microplus]|uniref:uncharacterized protein LOC142769276 n=1 Tax=Rhipicephalus microplus TaxID=6941 RepID=UPI003F6B7005